MSLRQRLRTTVATIARLGAAVFALLVLPVSAVGDTAWQVRAEEPRAFGHHVGDVVERRFEIEVPPGHQLERASLPAVGRHGKSVELRDLRWEEPAWWEGRRHRLTLVYQVFAAPTEVRLLELPPVKLRFSGGPRPEDLRLDAWPLLVAPLTPVEAPTRSGLGELRPDAPALAIDTGPSRARLVLWGALALIALAYLAQVYLLAPWWAARHRPFAAAHVALRRSPGPTSAAQRQQAYRALHRALNQTAGLVVFEGGLDAFIAAQPRFAPVRAELVDFFRRSRAEFFGTPGSADGEALDWLRTLARRCRDLERGAA